VSTVPARRVLAFLGHTLAVELVRTPEERFAELPDYPFEPRYAKLPSGPRVHYVDEGPAGAEPVLLLHGQPTWSYLYRQVIGCLVARGRRAVAPDLVGFGRSDKPLQRAAHTVPAHVGWLREFVDVVGLDGFTLVVQDWGGPFGLALLHTAPEQVLRVVAANTALHTAGADLAGRLAWPCHAGPGETVTLGTALMDYQRLTQELAPFRASLFVEGASASGLPADVLGAYDAPFPAESFCAGPRQLPLLMGLTPNSACARLNRRTFEALACFDRPFLTVFSDGDPGTRGWAEVLQARVPGALAQDHVTLAGAGHFLQEDAGAALADAIADMVDETPAR
jgi:haloalkane dehalogenase